jgi:hypothetical protein
MRRSLFWPWVAGLILPSSLAGCLHPPILWSPDGKWLAYTVVARPTAQVIVPGWLLGRADQPPTPLPQPSPSISPNSTSGLVYRLWATRVEDNVSVLLEESRGPLTSPGWSPDGRALAFGRMVAEDEGQARFEIVVQDAPDHQRVIQTEVIREYKPEAAKLPALACVWSPDGRYLAVPHIEPMGLAILRADNGRILKAIDDAFLPSWSPDATKLAFYRTGEPEGLYYVDANFGPPRHLADLTQASQAPVWERNGQSLLVVRRTEARRGPRTTTEQAELVRVWLDKGKTETVRILALDPNGHEKTFLGASFSFDGHGEDLFYTTTIEGLPATMTWCLPGDAVRKGQMEVFDRNVALGALAAAPDGHLLALRVGPPGTGAVPALYDPETERLSPLTPDDASRIAWIALTVQTARGILAMQDPPAAPGERAANRPTLLPAPGEPVKNPEDHLRLRRLARLGLELCDRPLSDSAEPEARAVLAEARLFFNYLLAVIHDPHRTRPSAHNYRAALAALEELEATTQEPDARLRLMGLRAQIALGLRDKEQASEIIAYLRTVQDRPVFQIEDTPVGPVLTSAESPADRWADALAEHAELLNQHPEPLGANPDAPVVGNPDAPEPDLNPADVFPMPRFDANDPGAPFRDLPPEIIERLILEPPPAVPPAPPRRGGLRINPGTPRSHPMIVPPAPAPAPARRPQPPILPRERPRN